MCRVMGGPWSQWVWLFAAIAVLSAPLQADVALYRLRPLLGFSGRYDPALNATRFELDESADGSHPLALPPGTVIDEVFVDVTFGSGQKARPGDLVYLSATSASANTFLGKYFVQRALDTRLIAAYIAIGAQRDRGEAEDEPAVSTGSQWTLALRGTPDVTRVSVRVTYHQAGAVAQLTAAAKNLDVISPQQTPEAQSSKLAALASEAPEEAYSSSHGREQLPEKAVVLVHGWNPPFSPGADTQNMYASKPSPRPVDRPWTTLQANLVETLGTSQPGAEWAIARYHWPIGAFTDLPSMARENAMAHGKHLGRLLYERYAANEKPLARLQLIAHSAGNWVARSAAAYLRCRLPELVLQVTSLDPFVDASLVDAFTLLSEPFPSVPGHAWVDYLDCFYTTDLTDVVFRKTSQPFPTWTFQRQIDAETVPGFFDQLGRVLEGVAVWDSVPYYDSVYGSGGLESAGGKLTPGAGHTAPVAWYALTAAKENQHDGRLAGSWGFAGSLAAREWIREVRLLSAAPVAGDAKLDVVSVGPTGVANSYKTEVSYFCDGALIRQSRRPPSFMVDWHSRSSSENPAGNGTRRITARSRVTLPGGRTYDGSECSTDVVVSDPARNRPPDIPDDLVQVAFADGAALAAGALLTDRRFFIQARLRDPDQDRVRLQVELQPAGSAFTGQPSQTRAVSQGSVASGSRGELLASALEDGGWKWQARTIDSLGQTSSWVAGPANALGTSVDVQASPAAQPDPQPGSGLFRAGDRVLVTATSGVRIRRGPAMVPPFVSGSPAPHGALGTVTPLDSQQPIWRDVLLGTARLRWWPIRFDSGAQGWSAEVDPAGVVCLSRFVPPPPQTPVVAVASGQGTALAGTVQPLRQLGGESSPGTLIDSLGTTLFEGAPTQEPVDWNPDAAATGIYFQASAVDAYGQRSIAEFEPGLRVVDSCPPIPAPVVRVAELSADHLVFTWDPVTGAQRYRIERAATGSQAFAALLETEGLSYADPTGPVGDHQYRVLALRDCPTAGLPSGVLIPNRREAPPGMFVAEAPVDGARDLSGWITLRWRVNGRDPSALRYNVYASTDPSSLYAQANRAVSDTPLTFTFLPDPGYGRTVYWGVEIVEGASSRTYGPAFMFQTTDNKTAPTVEVLGNTLFLESGTSLNVQGSASDSDPSDELRRQWSIVERPEGSQPALVNSTHAIATLIGATVPGTYRLRFTVSDRAGHVASVEQTIIKRIPSSISSARDWTPSAVVPQPTARAWYAMAFDVQRGAAVLYGGESGDTYFSDTWEWNGTSWRLAQTSSPPGRRSHHSMAYDPVRQRVVLFGGHETGVPMPALADFWAWNGTTWEALTAPSGPSARADSALAWDGASRALLIFGGRRRADNALLGDTWKLEGDTWLELFPASAPLPRAEHAMIADNVAGRVVLVGGDDGLGNSQATREVESWEWKDASWIRLATPGAPMGVRQSPLAFNAVRRRPMLHSLGRTYELTGTRWLEVFGDDPPLQRRGHAMAFDPIRREVVLFGGYDDSQGILGDTWLLPANSKPIASITGNPVALAGNTVRLTAANQFNDSQSSQQWDPISYRWSAAGTSAQTLALEGRSSREVSFRTTACGNYELELAVSDPYEPGTTSSISVAVVATDSDLARAQRPWQQLDATNAPSGRQSHYMVYDSTRGLTVLHGGFRPGGVLDDTWTFDGRSWSLVPAAAGPRSHRGSAVFDRVRGKMVLFGGPEEGDGATPLGNTWLFDGAAWLKVPPGTVPPPRVYDPALVYDAERQETLLYGGHDTMGDISVDTWAWNGESWRNKGNCGTPFASTEWPVPAAAFDPVRKVAVLVGGSATFETWEWDGTSWTQAHPPVSPPPRRSPAVTFDASSGTVVMFGGDGKDDTWTWDGARWLQIGLTSQLPGRGEARLCYHEALGRVMLFGGYGAPSDYNADTWTLSPPAGAKVRSRPAASLVPIPATAGVLETILFDASDSADRSPLQTALLFRWDLDGDSEIDTEPSTAGKLVRTFAEPGRYTVTVHVYGPDGENDSLTRSVQVFDPGPLEPASPTPADFSASAGLSTALSWSGCGRYPGAIIRYDVALGRTLPPPLVSIGLPDSSFTARNLEADSAYYWQVTAHSLSGIAVAGPIWRLATGRPPLVFVQPRSIRAPAGSGARFSVIASGSAPLSYQWFFEGRPLPGEVASSLSIPSVEPSRAGTYAVLVENPCGREASSTAVLELVSRDAPGPVSQFAAAPRSLGIELSWRLPLQPFSSVRVVRRPGLPGTTTGPADIVYEGDGTGFLDRTVASGQPYQYEAYSMDFYDRSGAAAVASAISFGEPPAAPNLKLIRNRPGTEDRLTGTAAVGSLVRVYDSSGALTIASAVVAGGAFDLAIGDNLHERVLVTATTPAGQEGTAVAVTNDIAPPDAPVLTITSKRPGLVDRATGTVEPGSIISLYSNSSRTTVVTRAVSSGTFSFSIGDNSTPEIFATATDEAGNESTAVRGTNDVSPPAPPVAWLDSRPPGAADRIIGSAETGAAIFAYASATQLQPVTSSIAVNGRFELSLGDNAVATAFVVAADSAGNTGAATVLANDVSAPAPPVLLMLQSRPGTLDRVTGTAEAGALIRLYSATSDVLPIAETHAPSGTFDLPLGDNTLGEVALTASDAARNVSAPRRGMNDIAGPRASIRLSRAQPLRAGALFLTATFSEPLEGVASMSISREGAAENVSQHSVERAPETSTFTFETFLLPADGVRVLDGSLALSVSAVDTFGNPDTTTLLATLDTNLDFNIPLKRGLNLISLPVRPVETMWASELASRLDADFVARLTAPSSGRSAFEVFLPPRPGSQPIMPDFTLLGGEAYFVEVSAPATLRLTGALAWPQEASRRLLRPGLNLVGLTTVLQGQGKEIPTAPAAIVTAAGLREALGVGFVATTHSAAGKGAFACSLGAVASEMPILCGRGYLVSAPVGQATTVRLPVPVTAENP